MQSISHWDAHAKYRISPPDPAALRHQDVRELLAVLLAHGHNGLRLREIGQSFAGRSIMLASIGEGATHVLLWSQMHGDEPTHTAVLLDLLNFLIRAPDSPVAARLLSGCTLHMIPMLNPDGAEQWTRRNAQGIDVNRDARRLATPEGRLLQAMVDDLCPQFAFNLHNQHPRSAVSGTLQPATVSLLVPPRDEQATETQSTRQAKRVAAAFLGEVEPYCGGSISRYRAEYMPRAFGESIQRQGVSTILVEAGHWAGKDAADLVQLHFVGLLAALEAIASNQLEEHDVAAYENLPLSAEHRLFDMKLQNVTVVDGRSGAPYTCDIGIALPSSPAGEKREQRSGATIEDMGDLSVTSANVLLADCGICLAGRIAFDRCVTPLSIPAKERCDKLLRSGITTLVGEVDVADSAVIEALAAMRSDARFPVNLGFVASIAATTARRDEVFWENLLAALGCGVLALMVDDETSRLMSLRQRLPLAVLARKELMAIEVCAGLGSIAQLAAQNYTIAKRLGLDDRGSIQCDSAADLLLSTQALDVAEFDPGDIRHVLVNGVHAVSDGQVTRNNTGRWLRRAHPSMPDL